MKLTWPLLALGLGLCASCTTGPISLGNDGSVACAPEECGTQPVPDPMCLDGNTGHYLCQRDGSQSCSWVALCPALECALSDCGEPPAESPMCPMSPMGLGWACERSSEAGCHYEPVCPEDGRECPLSDCEVPTADATECSSQGMAGSGCLRNDEGDCRWTAIVCRGG